MAKNKAATNGSAAVLDAPAIMQPEIVVFSIVGIFPLLQNNPADFIGKVEGDGLAAGKKTYDDNEEAQRRTYVDSDGDFAHPCEAFTKAIVRAVTGKKFGKSSAPSLVKGSVFVVEQYAKLLDSKGRPVKKYDIDRRSVVINKKSRILRCRPSFPEWRLKLALEIDVAILRPEDVKDALSLAGRIIGVGDYRPEKGGGFGRFKVE